MITVLYVDDDPDYLDMGRRFLERSGDLCVIASYSGKKAIEMLEQDSFDAIIADYEMPGMNGIELLTTIRSCHYMLPFILFTCKTREEVLIRALNCGADSYLQKKGNPNVIFAELENIIKKNVERWRIKRALIDSEQRYRELVDSLPKTVIELDENLNLTYINNAGIKKLGYGHEDLKKNIQINDIFISLTDEDFQKQSYAIINKETDFSQEYIAVNKDGSTFPVKVYISPIYSKKIFNGFRAVCIDISEEKRVKSALIQVNKQLNLMTNITRHDILNKITALIALQSLSKELISEPQLLEYLTKQEQITEMIQKTIEFTRNYQEIGLKAPVWQNLKQIIFSTLEEIDTGPVSIELNIFDYYIYADQLLKNVFMNLIENSILHGDHVSQIRFYTDNNDRELKIVYTDDGVGIHSELKERIFAEGFGKHTGFGLFLIREILTITGITIIESGDYGSGARFEIIVPNGVYRSEWP